MKNINIPTAIIIAGALVAGAVIFTGGGRQVAVGQAADQKAIALAPLTKTDHLLGSTDAPIIIVEYSDTECPFCQRFHKTMNQVMEEYGKDGRVAWVYRHFPLDRIHSKARTEAQATECANELGGNTAFWTYLNRLFEITPANNGLDLALLPQIAEDIGLDRGAFVTCLESEKYADHIQEDLDGGVEAGVRGTPANFILLKDGTIVPLPSGAQPFKVVQSLIEENL